MACHIVLNKNSTLSSGSDKTSLSKTSFSSGLAELPESFIKANANPRLPRLLGMDHGTPLKEETIAELKASLPSLPRPRAVAPALGGMKRISSKVSMSDQVEMWVIPLAGDDEDMVQTPTKTIKALKGEQPASLRPRHVRNAQDSSGCCYAGLQRAIRFVFFGF